MRVPAQDSPYWLPKHTYISVVHFCYGYPEYKRRYDELCQTYKGINTDGMPHGNGISDPVAQAVEQREKLSKKIEMIENTADEVGGDLASYLKRGVTDEKATYNYLHEILRMPCGRETYYLLRRKFYKKISEKI